MATLKVIIVGSGLAGSCLANGLLHADIDVQVYERLPEGSKREGYQIRLGAAALKGLRACLSPEHLASIVQKFGRAHGIKSRAPIIVSQHFEQLVDLTKIPSYSKSAPINRVVLRDLLAAPLSRTGVLQYNKQFSRYEILAPHTDQERVRVHFEDGSTDECDILVAADGAHSKINKQIGLNNIRQLDGYVSLVAKNELPTEELLKLPRIAAEHPLLAFSDKKALYFCAYLPEKFGESGVYDEDLSSSFLGLHVPENDAPPNLGKQSKEEQWDFVSRTLSGWSQEYHAILDTVKQSSIYVYKGNYSIEPAKNWRSKVKSRSQPELGHARVWLVGDAMHAMLPNRGMGGNTAMHDTAIALDLLTQLSMQKQPSHHDIEQALKAYEDEMVPRAFEWVRKSGGSNIAPIDTNTGLGMLLVRLGAVVVTLIGWWYSLTGLFRTRVIIDDAPELR